MGSRACASFCRSFRHPSPYQHALLCTCDSSYRRRGSSLAPGSQVSTIIKWGWICTLPAVHTLVGALTSHTLLERNWSAVRRPTLLLAGLTSDHDENILLHTTSSGCYHRYSSTSAESQVWLGDHPHQSMPIRRWALELTILSIPSRSHYREKRMNVQDAHAADLECCQP